MRPRCSSGDATGAGGTSSKPTRFLPSLVPSAQQISNHQTRSPTFHAGRTDLARAQNRSNLHHLKNSLLIHGASLQPRYPQGLAQAPFKFPTLSIPTASILAILVRRLTPYTILPRTLPGSPVSLVGPWQTPSGPHASESSPQSSTGAWSFGGELPVPPVWPFPERPAHGGERERFKEKDT